MRFAITRGAEFLGGITAGRLQVSQGMTPLDAFAKRIRRDAHMRFVTLQNSTTTQGPTGEVLAWHYEVLLKSGRPGAPTHLIQLTIEALPAIRRT